MVRKVRTQIEKPDAAAWPIFAQYFIAVRFTNREFGSIAKFIERLSISTSQLAVVLVLYPDRPQRVWKAWLVRKRAPSRIDRLNLIGSSIKDDQSKSEQRMPDEKQRLRHSRTESALTLRVFLKAFNSTVAIVGASRTGSLLAFQLASCGVRRIYLVDPDWVEPHNLDGGVGFVESDIGNPKVESLARRLIEFRGDLVVHAIQDSICEPAARKRLVNVDMVVTTVDSDAARLAVSRLLTTPNLILHLDIGTGIQRNSDELLIAADVRLMIPGKGCIECIGGLNNRNIALRELNRPKFALRKERNWQDERAGSLVTINSMAVSIGVQCWLDLLARRLEDSFWARLAWQQGIGLSVDQSAVQGNPDCRYCQT